VNLDSRPRSRRVILGCLIIYVVAAALLFWPATPWSAARLPERPFRSNYGFGDPAQMTWFLAWVPYALRHGLDLFHTNFLDYPSGVDLANGQLAPLLGLLAAPFTITLGPVAAFNVLLRLAFASSAGSMFLVLRTWSRWPVAFVGGLLYGFGPYMVAEGHLHLNLVFVPLFPIMVWCLYELLVTRRRSPLRMGLLLGALAGAQALIEPELLALMSIVVLIGLIGGFIVCRRGVRVRLAHLGRAAIPALIVFVAITGYMIWSLLFAPGHLAGPTLPVARLQLLRADLLGPVVPTVNQLISSTSSTSYIINADMFVHGNLTENTSYLGLPIVILISAFALKWRRDAVVALSTLLALVALILSLGSRLTIDGHTTWVPMPEAILAHVPLLDNMMPVRFSFVVWLFAVIAFVTGADHFLRWLAIEKPLYPGVRAVEVGGVVLLTLALVLDIPRAPFKTRAPNWPPDTVSTLNSIPVGSVVLTYPFTLNPFTEAMSWQAADGMRFRLIGGYASVQGGGHYGSGNAPLLSQPYVQEYLTEAQYGSSSLSPYPAPNPSINPQAALCQFLAAFHVGAVVFWNVGAEPTGVRHTLVRTLGPPTRTTLDGSVLVWLVSPNHCLPKVRP
jgi:hypothetical protein